MAALALARAGLRKETAPRILLSIRRSPVSTDAVSLEPRSPGVEESREEYRFVERLIPPTQVPEPPKHGKYPTPSGWRPPQDPAPDLPFFVRRSRMHNVPVYTDITHGCRKMTVIRKIEGDIWALEKEVKAFLTDLSGETPLTQVNEVASSLRIKGYFDKELKAWLVDKGF
ncbi:large ribosomal subunit protein mL49 [Anolis carolinensis]|uniref:large ribosomal subunit protein mL49 n=1 Tax=Anolis carolinensis TaxID=28377 RepID=UPI002F2B505B